MGKGLGTWIVVAVCAVGLAAAVDAVRGDGEPGRTADTTRGERPQRISDGARVSRALREAGATGILFYADDACRIHALALPELDEQPAPAERSCDFVPGAAGTFSPGPAIPDPRGSLTASCDDGTLEVRTRYAVLLARTRACAPAWKPSGVLTAVRRADLVEFRISGAETPRRLAARVALSAREVEGALRRDPWRLSRARLEAVAWLNDRTVAAVVSDRRADESVLALFRDGRLLAATPYAYEGLGNLRVSPRGTYVTARIDGGGVLVLDRRGRLVRIALPSASAIAWSPDERFVAAVSRGAVFVFRMRQRSTPLIRIPVEASDVFWR